MHGGSDIHLAVSCDKEIWLSYQVNW